MVKNHRPSGMTIMGVVLVFVILLLNLVIIKNINWADITVITYFFNAVGNIVSPMTCKKEQNDLVCGELKFPKDDISGVTNFLKIGLTYEPWFSKICKRFSNKSQIAIDIGAHIGYHTKTMAAYFDQVYAFEPNPNIYKYLVRNMQNHKNVTCLPFGVAEKNGQFCFNTNDISARSNVSGDQTTGCKTVVKTISLDRLNVTHKIGFIKIDIEGGEIRALGGMLEIISRDTPIIVFEDHSQETVRWFYTNVPGYKITAIDASNYLASKF